MKNLKSITLALVFILVLSASFVLRDGKPSIAFVKSQELIYNYDGTKDAQAKFSKQKTDWETNLQTLRSEFQQAVKEFEEGQAKMTKSQRQEKRSVLVSKEKQLLQYTKAIEDKIAQTDKEIMQGVLNQINSFTAAYALENGYDLILGTTESGTVLYGKEALDITDQLLVALNNEFNGQ